MLLAGDIGGTNTRLALFSDDARTIVRQDILPSRSHRSLSAAIDAFLDAPGGKRPKLRAATFGIAGPVIDQRVKATNLPWHIDARALARHLSTPKVTLLNDLVALAIGAVEAPKKDVHVIHGKRAPRGGANVAVIAAGTGLGEAGLVWDGTRLVPCGTEGGHSDFAPRSDLEWELQRFIARRIGGRVSAERVLSGPGIGTLYDFFRSERGVVDSEVAIRAIEGADDRNAAITRLGASGDSEIARHALELFASLYGAEAGNLALKFLATGGVFVAGAIGASMIPVLERAFVPAFLDKGRMGPLLAAMPIAVAKSSSIGLHGSAKYAAATAG